MAKFHAQIWQFWKSARISETAARTRRAKISSISHPWGGKRVYATSGPLANGHVLCPNMAILKISEIAARRAKISSISTPWGGKRVYVQLLELWSIAKFHAHLWLFWKSACISETAGRRAKISSILTPGVERDYMSNFVMPKYGNFEKWPVSKKPLPVEQE